MQTSTKVLIGLGIVAAGALVYSMTTGSVQAKQQKLKANLPADQKSLYDAAAQAVEDLATKALTPQGIAAALALKDAWNASPFAAKGGASDELAKIAPVDEIIGVNFSDAGNSDEEQFA